MILSIYTVSEKWAESECFYTQFFTLLELVFSLKYHGNAYYAYCSTGQRYRYKVHRQSQLGTRIPILDDFESRVSRTEFWGTVNLFLTGTSDIFENVKTKRDRTEPLYF